MRIGLVLIGLLALAVSTPASACDCPKESLLKLHGTISAFGDRRPAGPRRIAPSPAQASVKPAIPPLLLLISAEGDARPTSFLRARRLAVLPDLLVQP